MAACIGPWIEPLRGWLRSRSDLVLEIAAQRPQLVMYQQRRPDVRVAWNLPSQRLRATMDGR